MAVRCFSTVFTLSPMRWAMDWLSKPACSREMISRFRVESSEPFAVDESGTLASRSRRRPVTHFCPLMTRPTASWSSDSDSSFKW